MNSEADHPRESIAGLRTDPHSHGIDARHGREVGVEWAEGLMLCRQLVTLN